MFKYCGGGIFLIFFWNDSIYHICNSFGKYFNLIYNVTLTWVTLSELHSFTIWYKPVYMYTYKWYIWSITNLYEWQLFSPFIFWKGRQFIFPWCLARTTDEVEHPWYLSYHGDFLGVWHSNYAIFWYTQRSPTREQRGETTASNFFTIGIEVLGFCI